MRLLSVCSALWATPVSSNRRFAFGKTRSTFLTSLILLAPFVASAETASLHVMIDPGHGGSDTGAVRGSLKESEIALKVAGRLAERLRKDPRFKVTMTRTSDQKVSLPRRTQMSQEVKADLFVSIHLNSSTDPRAHGTEIYFQNQLPVDEEALYLLSRENEGEDVRETTTSDANESMSTHSDLKRILEDLRRNHRIQASSELGKTLLDTLIENGAGHRLGSRVIRQAPFHVVSATQVPSVLVELGFLTHPQEGPQLADAAYQEKLAGILAEGLAKFVAHNTATGAAADAATKP